MLRDPQNPFLTNSALQFSGISQFTNTGQDGLWNYFAADELSVLPSATSFFPVPTEGHHAMVTMRDPLTGKTRVIFGNNHGVYTATDDGTGVATTNVGTAVSVAGTGAGANTTVTGASVLPSHLQSFRNSPSFGVWTSSSPGAAP